MKIGRNFALLACLVGASWSTTAFGQAFPQRDLSFVVPWNAGGSNDVAARALDPILRELGIKIVVENVVGATGVIGMRRVASASPDGYTLGMGTSSTLALIAQGKAPLTNAQFDYIARVSTDPLMLLVPTNAPQKTLEEFIAHLKANPGKVTIGTPGNYNLNHIFASMTARAAGVEYVNVPYTGGSKVVADLLGHHVDAGVLKPSETLGQIQEGLLRPIGIFANERLELFPDVPTFKERGFDVFPYGPDGLRRRARQSARGCPRVADQELPPGDPGSALQGVRQEERLPGRRPHGRCARQGSRQRRGRARHRGGAGLPERREIIPSPFPFPQ
ncbi:hypothetical protein ES703_119047 [subsurface metagenome]